MTTMIDPIAPRTPPADGTRPNSALNEAASRAVQQTQTETCQLASRIVECLMTAAITPVDLASLVVVRVGFGLIAVWWAIDYIVRGRMRALYIDPQFNFTYYGFDWLRPWPGVGMYVHFGVLALAGLAIAAGLRYRLAATVFACGVTYFFLLDRTNYQNHYYLLVLVSWMMVLLPLHRQWSMDVLDGFTSRRPDIPSWMLWLVRFHIGLPYFFGGVAKLEGDWFAGAPLRQTLAAHDWWPLIGPWFHMEPVVQLFIWGGLLFDLLVVPGLLWKPTRVPAYLLCVLFHLTNSQLFSIHIFPWFMIVATTVFFEPDWPRRLFGLPAVSLTPTLPAQPASPDYRTRIIAGLLCVYCLFHCIWPLRHLVYPGPASWTEQGHHFAWRMMLRGKTVGIRYYLTDMETRVTQLVDPSPILSPVQIGVFPRDPEMVLHLAHRIAEEYQRMTGRQAEVRALVLTSFNGRKPQLQIDPNVNLAAEPRGWHRRTWILPQTEPLPDTPWTVPLDQWEQNLDLPIPQWMKMPVRSTVSPAEAVPSG